MAVKFIRKAGRIIPIAQGRIDVARVNIASRSAKHMAAKRGAKSFEEKLFHKRKVEHYDRKIQKVNSISRKNFAGNFAKNLLVLAGLSKATSFAVNKINDRKRK